MTLNQSSDPLTALVDIISTQTAVLQSAYKNDSTKVPSIDDPYQPTPLEFDPSITAARNLIVAAATQLIATVGSPHELIYANLSGEYDTVTMGFIVDVNIPEILKEAGTQGLHVDELSLATGIGSSYIARVLRYLATRHFFKEVSPNVFAHNRLSSLLTKAKSLKEIKEESVEYLSINPLSSSVESFSPASRYDNSSIAACSQMAYNPKQASAPFNIAYNTPEKMWEWTEKPGNELVSRKFGAAMQNIGEMSPSEVFTSGIEADKLKANDIVVDVGGGVGTLTLTLKKAFPNLRYIVQDLDQQIFWAEKDPEAIKVGQVQLQAHDFGKPQPIKGAAVYLLRMVLHNCSDDYARKLLSNLRFGADINKSKLVVFEMLAKHVTEEFGSGVSVPYPLLPNLGVVGGGSVTSLDMAMLTMYDGQERTLEEYTQLGKEAGWKLNNVKKGELAALIFTPI
ncbi:S-adenosyl-L-methionine-dependent methyltransferase [Lentinula edodes]|uniref:S-adenosyl-L-methionine-dependent methyltransferase n=1 Tax=Lentinula edodes TaxID=5353 RepID=UPI001E8D5438|nr:S-adenosyl-L-methionine-dependent methyltransferase [Lentinula edodes]KAH7870634.1 S-adenosyl-L-methionine-dependent methyltransferase [Lentinula edodes]